MVSDVKNIDCVEGMKAFPDKFFDLAIVDPPYGVGDFNQRGKPENIKWRIDWNDSIPDEEYFYELFRVSKGYIIWGGNYFKQYVKSAGTIVWDKGNRSPIGSQAEIATTNLFRKVVLYAEKWAGCFNSEKLSGADKIHPCQKPIGLYRWMLNTYGKEGNKILDTHLGSQSSRIAAQELGFDFWGFETDEEYYEQGNKRYANHIAQQRLAFAV